MLEPLLVAGNLLPARLRERVYAASGGLTAVPATGLGRPFVEDVAALMTSLYPRRRYPLALIGSSNGAAVHLAAALGALWPPQTFMVPIRNSGNDPDDPPPRPGMGPAAGPGPAGGQPRGAGPPHARPGAGPAHAGTDDLLPPQRSASARPTSGSCATCWNPAGPCCWLTAGNDGR